MLLLEIFCVDISPVAREGSKVFGQGQGVCRNCRKRTRLTYSAGGSQSYLSFEKPTSGL